MPLYSLICVARRVAIAVPWLSAKGLARRRLTDGHIPHALIGVFVVVALYRHRRPRRRRADARTRSSRSSVGLLFLLVLENILLRFPGQVRLSVHCPAGRLGDRAHTNRDGDFNGVHLLSDWPVA